MLPMHTYIPASNVNLTDWESFIDSYMTWLSALNLDRNESQKMSTSLVLIQLNDRLRSIGGREFQR